MSDKKKAEPTVLTKTRGITPHKVYAVDDDMLFHIMDTRRKENGESLKDSFNWVVQMAAIAQFGEEKAAGYFNALRRRNQEVGDLEAYFQFREDITLVVDKNDKEKTVITKTRGITPHKVFAVDDDMLFHIMKTRREENGQDLKDSFNWVMQMAAIAQFGKEKAAGYFNALRRRNQEVGDLEAEFHFRDDIHSL